eukprot:scaffold110771_cov17-Tisochrysis_lutea.AAC.1
MASLKGSPSGSHGCLAHAWLKELNGSDRIRATGARCQKSVSRMLKYCCGQGNVSKDLSGQGCPYKASWLSCMSLVRIFASTYKTTMRP